GVRRQQPRPDAGRAVRALVRDARPRHADAASRRPARIRTDAGAAEPGEREGLNVMTEKAATVNGTDTSANRRAPKDAGSSAKGAAKATAETNGGAGRAGSDGAVGEITYREALRSTLRSEMLRDEKVFLMGEEIGVFEGSYKITAGLLAEFGPERVRDTPIAEEGFVGAAIGAAMLGLRPVVEI